MKSLYFKIFSASLLITFLSPRIAASINTQVSFLLSRIMLSGLLLRIVQSVCTCWFHIWLPYLHDLFRVILVHGHVRCLILPYYYYYYYCYYYYSVYDRLMCLLCMNTDQREKFRTEPVYDSNKLPSKEPMLHSLHLPKVIQCPSQCSYNTQQWLLKGYLIRTEKSPTYNSLVIIYCGT